MKITLRLYATLQDYLPSDARGNEASLEVPDGATVPEALAVLSVPLSQAHIVMVNGRHVVRSQVAQKTLQDGDELAVWPAIGGG